MDINVVIYEGRNFFTQSHLSSWVIIFSKGVVFLNPYFLLPCPHKIFVPNNDHIDDCILDEERPSVNYRTIAAAKRDTSKCLVFHFWIARQFSHTCCIQRRCIIYRRWSSLRIGMFAVFYTERCNNFKLFFMLLYEVQMYLPTYFTS